MRPSLRRLALMATLTLAATPAPAQDWGTIGSVMMQNLTASGTAAASFWLPNAADPAIATIGLGVAYEHIPGSAGNTGIAVGFFIKQDDAWVFAGLAQNIFGQTPSDPIFTQTHAEVTTIMPGPNDPRCCPTVPTRWRIDYETLQATRLN